MQQIFEKRRWTTRLGFIASLILHAALLALIMVKLPDPSTLPQPDSIPVELVPPMEVPATEEKPAEQEKQPEEKAAEEPSPSSPAEQLPQAFESASPEGGETPGTSPSPQEESGEEAKTEPSPRKPETAAGEDSEEKQQAPNQLTALSENSSAELSAPDTEEKSGEGDQQAAAPSDMESQQDFKEAQQLYSEAALSDPRVRQAIGRLPPNRRIVQVCSIEALEQIRRAVPGSFPDMLVPYASNGGLISDQLLKASRGAYRSLGRWYGIDFQCEVNAEFNRLVSFRYQVGPAIPESEWSRRKLPGSS